MPWTGRVAKIECDKYETKLTVPGHSFPRGAEIRVDGIPMLDGGRFFVDHYPRMGRSSFNICQNVSVDVAEIDSANSVVRTKVPHQLGENHSSLKLFAFDPVANEQIKRSYCIREVIDDTSLRLQEYCAAKKIFLPAELGADWKQTRLQKEACKVVLPQACSSEIAAIASLVPKPPPSPKSCLQEWQQAVRAARSASKLTEPVQEPGQPKSPDVSLLRVGNCGWDDCSGLFERTAHLDFQKDPGLVFLRYIEHLGWCLFADVQPLHPLREERLYLNLAAGQAPQLLYIRQDPEVCGQWEPVIGPAPGPFVAVHREISVRSRDQTGTQPSLLLMPGVSSAVLDVLCNYYSADWRGGMNHAMASDSVWGQSPVQALLSAFTLFQDIMSCSAVCRTWREALTPFADLQTLCYRALGLPEGSKVKLPSIQECVCSTVLAGMLWEDPISGSGHSIFRSNAWPALISEVEISSEMGEDEEHSLRGPACELLNKHAPTFQQVARQILREVPLAWKTKPRTLSLQWMGDYQLATCDLLGFSASDTGKQSCDCLAQEGELLALDGSRLLPPSTTALSPLEIKGLRLQSSSFGKSSTVRQAKAPGARCGTVYCSIPKEETEETEPSKEKEGCPFCADSVDGQVGASQFSGYFQMLFSTSDSKLISFKIKFDFPTCFATSEGPEIITELQKLVPWCMDALDDWDNEDDGSLYGEDVDDDEDPGENDQTDPEEEEMEEGEEEEEVNGIQERENGGGDLDSS
ncbi:pkaR [Symbiodinium sp. CCMP2456]|nr:pkaR [Symbiodinium sp. CCMP2456]